MSKLDDKDVSKIAAGGGSIGDVAPGDPPDPPADPGDKYVGGGGGDSGGGGGGGTPIEGEDPNTGIGQG